MSAVTGLALLALALGVPAMAASPVLYHQSGFQSPVAGGPNDLLLLAGYGLSPDDTVIYRALADGRTSVEPPTDVSQGSNARFGIAPIVSTAGVPYALTVQLPDSLRSDQAYALWVRTKHGEWSHAVTINDARPLWISPSVVYTSSMPASLPRELKIIGRNLEPSQGRSTTARLTGPQRFELPSVPDQEGSDSLSRYVLRVALPGYMPPGTYRIAVNRDGVNWVELKDQELEVLPQGSAKGQFDVGDAQYGGCRPDDDVADTECLVRALEAAKTAGGGVVRVGPGTWDLIAPDHGASAPEGIIIPEGVELQGSGERLTTLRRHPEWNSRAAMAALTLMSHSGVSGFTFHDLQTYRPGDHAAPFLQLGMDDRRFMTAAAGASPTAIVDTVVITHNIFDKPLVAIGSGGLPLRRVFITDNTFGAFHAALELTGDKYYVNQRYGIDDSVIDDNRFEPGSDLDVGQKSGSIASELGAGHRVDFSGNTADGSSTEFLYSSDDPKGWRAVFFWNMNDNVEEMLVSQNTATCTSDKIGDGEAIAFDNNDNTFGLGGVAVVVEADATSVSIAASLVQRQNGRDVALKSYYIGHWIQIASGPGLGEARKIVSYSIDPVSGITTFQVSPRWDVAPTKGRSQIAVGREFWQVYTLSNRVDDHRPLCQKSNRSRKAGGLIGMWAQSVDSVIAGNRQYDTDGIFVQQNYDFPQHPCVDCTMTGFFQSFLEIRDNVIDGEYDWSTDCSASGIAMGTAAAPWSDAPPPTVGFGNLIAHNTVRHADGQRGGAISQIDSWIAGPVPHRWPLSENLLIYENVITDIDGPRSLPVCTTSRPRIGIAFPDAPIAWHTVLSGNRCQRVSLPVGPGGVETTAVCPSHSHDSCECPP